MLVRGGSGRAERQGSRYRMEAKVTEDLEEVGISYGRVVAPTEGVS